MKFGWINGINAMVVICLIFTNVIAEKRGAAGAMDSRKPVLNFFEQLGRYGCMILMVLPVLTPGWKFGFFCVAEMVIWLLATAILLLAYILLWFRKKRGGPAALYGLAIVPAALLLINGILLRHPLLIAFSLIFGVSHVWIAKENIR